MAKKTFFVNGRGLIVTQRDEHRYYIDGEEYKSTAFWEFVNGTQHFDGRKEPKHRSWKPPAKIQQKLNALMMRTMLDEVQGKNIDTDAMEYRVERMKAKALKGVKQNKLRKKEERKKQKQLDEYNEVIAWVENEQEKVAEAEAIIKHEQRKIDEHDAFMEQITGQSKQERAEIMEWVNGTHR